MAMACQVLWCLGTTAPAHAQMPGVHYPQSGVSAPGAIGAWQLQRGGPLPGFFQPVEIRGPQGALISLAIEGQFSEPEPSPRLVALAIAGVYRIRVTGIEFHEGEEVFPTIELIDRLYAPAGQAARFPIPVELTHTDLELALEGKFVTRVIYLEDPDRALPRRQAGHETQWLDAGQGENPLKLADELGRPVALLRIGGRQPVPGPDGTDEAFLHGCPPLLVFHRDPTRQVLGARHSRKSTAQVIPVQALAPRRARNNQ